MSLLMIIDLTAVAVFAVTGALSASRRGMDVIGFVWLGAVTGIGGGTTRDLLLGVPVFWVKEPLYLLVAVAVSILVYFGAHLPKSRYRAILWLDAVGLAFVSVAGASKALAVGAPAAPAVTMGVITATLGGIVRDILAHQPSILMKREIYITASLAGAVVYVAAVGLALPQTVAVVGGLAVGFGLRAGAMVRGWTLPGHDPAVAMNGDDDRKA